MEVQVKPEEITKIVGLILGVRSVEAGDRIVEDLGAESADLLNIIATVEETYHIEITESEAARIYTSADLYALVDHRLSGSA